MIYYDSCYIAKWYVAELDSLPVRATAIAAGCVAVCNVVRLEFASILHRHVREGKLTAADATALMAQFELDVAAGQWALLPVNEKIIQDSAARVLALPEAVLIRAVDALHLTCAWEHGFRDVYTSDRHMLGAAPHFGLNGIKL